MDAVPLGYRLIGEPRASLPRTRVASSDTRLSIVPLPDPWLRTSQPGQLDDF
jgi:hypothetical protein